MSSTLDIGDAITYGIGRLATRGGAILIAAYAIVQTATQVGFQSFFAALFADVLPEMYPDLFGDESMMAEMEQAYPLAVDLPLGVSAAVIAVLLLVSLVLWIVAMRAIYADIDRVPTADHTRRLLRTSVVLIALSIVTFVAVTIGFIFLILPGIFLAISFAFAPLAVVIEDAGVVGSLRRSWELASGNRIMLFVLGVLVGVIAGVAGAAFGLVGVASPLLGDLLSAVVTAVASLFGIGVLVGAYRQLADRDDRAAAAAESPSRV